MLNIARRVARRAFSTAAYKGDGFGPMLSDFLPDAAPAFWDQPSFDLLKRWPVTPEMLPNNVDIVEVGPRDGLQYEKHVWPIARRISLIEALASTGLREVEVGSVVSPKRVPQMAHSDIVLDRLRKRHGVNYHMLVPNPRAMEAAIMAGVKSASIFVSPSETFSKRNINRTVPESLADAKISCSMAALAGVRVRGYVSCITHTPDPNERIEPEQVVAVAAELIDMGCYQVSLGDTLGRAMPNEVVRLIRCFPEGTRGLLAGHFHDTHGHGAANAVAAMHFGVRTFDTAVAGLGGCPFAGSATGNLDTRKLLYVCNALRVETGVDYDAIIDISDGVLAQIERRRKSNEEALGTQRTR